MDYGTSTDSPRARLARWLTAVGEDAEAQELRHELLVDQVAVLGPEHPQVAETRAPLATPP